MPVDVYLSNDQQWTVTRQRRHLTLGHARLQPGHAQCVRSNPTLPIRYTSEPSHPARLGVADNPGPWTLTLNPDVLAFQGAFGAAQTQQAQASIARTAARFERLLELSTGPVTLDIIIQDIPDPNALANTPINHFGFPHNAVIQNIILKAQDEVQPQPEVNYYQALNPQQIPFRHTGNTVFQATIAGVAPALVRHLSPTVPNDPPHATISIDPNFAWDFNPLDGPPPQGSHEFEGILTHEVFHALGFSTLAEEKGVTDALTVWDWCRFPESNGPDISPTEATSNPRELRPTIEAIYATLLNSAASTFRGARGLRAGGDGNGANHWKDFEHLNPMVPIGLMDPFSGDVAVLFGFRQVRKPDLQALDIIGWNLNSNTFNIGGAAPAPQQPGNGQQRVSVAPTLQWDPGPGNEKWHVFVWEGATAGVGSPVFSATDLFTTSAAVPASTPLKAGRVHSWRATGENVAGYLYSTVFTFETCYADCNQDTTLSVADFGCFQTKFGAGDPYADCNADTQLTVADFGCFQTKFIAGCP